MKNNVNSTKSAKARLLSRVVLCFTVNGYEEGVECSGLRDSGTPERSRTFFFLRNPVVQWRDIVKADWLVLAGNSKEFSTADCVGK
jgi:hypothetical protein